MKKVLALSLSLIMMLALAACGSSNSTGSTTEGGEPFTGTLPELIAAIYEKQPVEIEVGEPMEIDLSDAGVVSYYTGLADASAVKEAYFSESMIGSQAYSLVAVRVNDAADAATVAQAMFDGIDQVKWICATADSLAVGAYEDMVVLAMVDSTIFGASMHTDLRDAFASVVGADTLSASLDRVDPDAMPKSLS